MLNDGFYSISGYVECGTTTLERIKRIDFIIEQLELKMLDMVEGAVYEEYQLDNGQMKTRVRYRTTTQFMDGIKSLEQLKARLVNRLNGRTTVLRSGKF